MVMFTMKRGTKITKAMVSDEEDEELPNNQSGIYLEKMSCCELPCEKVFDATNKPYTITITVDKLASPI